MRRIFRGAVVCATALLFAGAPLGAPAEVLHVVATTPDLGDLTRSVGGDAVEVTNLGKGPQDIHFLEPRPSFVRALHRADALVLTGMDLEIAWLPALLRGARNPDVSRGGRGHIDASIAIEPLEVPSGKTDRSMGDVHPYGNPHYLTDPLNGLAVARLLRDRLSALRPEAAATFEEGYARFAARLATALVGETLAGEALPEALETKLRAGEIDASSGRLGGWLGRADTAAIASAVQDHRYWPYFAKRFGVALVETLEPRPGIAPTTAHLQRVIEHMRKDAIPVVLATPYFDPRHARFVSEHSGARIAQMAHQVGSVPEATDYLAMIDHNVREVFGSE
jgi:ABC-type Zn uptake system ZnuABC Zn-binding protein ZnuA